MTLRNRIELNLNEKDDMMYPDMDAYSYKEFLIRKLKNIGPTKKFPFKINAMVTLNYKKKNTDTIIPFYYYYPSKTINSTIELETFCYLLVEGVEEYIFTFENNKKRYIFESIENNKITIRKYFNNKYK